MYRDNIYRFKEMFESYVYHKNDRLDHEIRTAVYNLHNTATRSYEHIERLKGTLV